MAKGLIVYYSHSGNTEKLARLIAAKTGADMIKAQPLSDYPEAYQSVVEQAKKEIAAGYLPPLREIQVSLAEYDTLYIGTPKMEYLNKSVYSA